MVEKRAVCMHVHIKRLDEGILGEEGGDRF
jgi:hypothetical protein